MADIAMCLDTRCPSKRLCKRYESSVTIPNLHYQLYAAFQHSHNAGKCADYWPITPPTREE